MRSSRQVQETSTRASQRRRTLSNITNLSLSASWVCDPREGLLAKTPSKSSSFAESKLREENTALKRSVSEKDGVIETQAAEMDLMQKEFFFKLRCQTQVNDELISYNSRLSKESVQLRDQLKLLQHEYTQMTVAYKVSQKELQGKLGESQELLAAALRERSDKYSIDQSLPTKTSKKPRSTQRRHSVAELFGEEDWNGSVRPDCRRQQDGVKRGDTRSSSACRETTSGSRQADNAPAVIHTRSSSTNLYGDLIGLDPMPEGSCEGDFDSPRPSLSEETSSSTGDDSSKSGRSAGSGLTSESTTSTRRKSTSNDSAVLGKRDASQPVNTKPGNNMSKANQRVPSVTTSVPTPHFSRRVAISSSLSTESGRPIRRAVVKVGSYTEPALNTKMRRPY